MIDAHFEPANITANSTHPTTSTIHNPQSSIHGQQAGEVVVEILCVFVMLIVFLCSALLVVFVFCIFFLFCGICFYQRCLLPTGFVVSHNLRAYNSKLSPSRQTQLTLLTEGAGAASGLTSFGFVHSFCFLDFRFR